MERDMTSENVENEVPQHFEWNVSFKVLSRLYRKSYNVAVARAVEVVRQLVAGRPDEDICRELGVTSYTLESGKVFLKNNPERARSLCWP